MPRFSWNDIPLDLQTLIGAGDPASLGPLSVWLSEHPQRFVSEDVCQKVLATLCRLMSSPRGRSLIQGAGSVSKLLRKIASRHRDDERRGDDRMRRAIFALGMQRSAACDDSDPAAIVSAHEIHRAILVALATLSQLERDVLVRALVLRQSYREIACSVLRQFRGAMDEIRLRKIVWRAKKRLRAQLRNLRAR